MADLELRRAPDDRRLFELEGVGSLRIEGLAGRRATAQAGGRSWTLRPTGWLRNGIRALDHAGEKAAEFVPARGLRRGGVPQTGDVELALRPATRWRERYALVDGSRELALLDGGRRSRRPVPISLADRAQVAPLTLLFAAFVAHRLASDAAAAASVSTAGGAAG